MIRHRGPSQGSMPIPEAHLSRWSDHGSQAAAKRTHRKIRNVLGNHKWPRDMAFDVFLQGSYANDTNLEAASDVDVVLVLDRDSDSVVISPFQLAPTLPPESDACRWNEFRREALKALGAGFGSGDVAQGDKSIKIKEAKQRLAADVVVCVPHGSHSILGSISEGVTFMSLREKRWIVNFPKEHMRNGADKGRRTQDRYRRTVRMFKNARNHLLDEGRITTDVAPSYFVECLIYNAPDYMFQPRFDETYRLIVDWFARTHLDGLRCQNGRLALFGPSTDQWTTENARTFVRELVGMWNDWS